MVLRLLIFICLFAMNAGATTYYVNKIGNDSNDGLDSIAANAWLHIAKACTTAVSGDTVMLGAGDYSDSMAVAWDPSVDVVCAFTNNNVTLKGDRAIPTLLGDTTTGSYRVPVYLGGSTRADSCTFDSIRVAYGFRTGFGIAHTSSGGHYTTIKNCIVDTCGWGDFGNNNGGVWSYANSTGHVTNLRVTNTTFRAIKNSTGGAANSAAIQMYACDSCEFDNNIIDDCGFGIWLKGPTADPDTVTNVNIHHNTITNTVFAGSAIEIASQGYFRDIDVHHNVIDAGGINSAGIMLRQLAFADDTWIMRRVRVFNNTVIQRASTQSSILLRDCPISAVPDSLVDSCDIWNNLVYDPVATTFGAKNDDVPESGDNLGAPKNSLLDNNYIYTDGVSNPYRWGQGGSDNTYTLAQMRASTIHADNSVVNTTLDPTIFVSLATGDFHLTANAPAKIKTGGVVKDGMGESYIGAYAPPRIVFKGWKP